MIKNKKKNKKSWEGQSPEQKLETFASMLDKSILSYRSLIKRSLISGLFTGLGATIGVAIIFILLTLLFQVLGQIPFIGTYADLISRQLESIQPGKK